MSTSRAVASARRKTVIHYTESASMYVCIYVYMHVCIYVCTYVCTYAFMYVCMYVYTCLPAGRQQARRREGDIRDRTS